MPDHTDNINLDKIVFDDQNVERRLWSCSGQICSRYLIVFLSQFFVILLIVCGCFSRIHLANASDEITVWVGSCAVQQDTFYLHQPMNKLISTKNRIFISLVTPSDSGKTYLIQEWLKVGTF